MGTFSSSQKQLSRSVREPFSREFRKLPRHDRKTMMLSGNPSFICQSKNTFLFLYYMYIIQYTTLFTINYSNKNINKLKFLKGLTLVRSAEEELTLSWRCSIVVNIVDEATKFNCSTVFCLVAATPVAPVCFCSSYQLLK